MHAINAYTALNNVLINVEYQLSLKPENGICETSSNLVPLCAKKDSAVFSFLNYL